MKKVHHYLLLSSALLFAACSDDDADEATESSLPGELTFTISNQFGTEDFALDATYTTGAGDEIIPTELRYWVSNIVLTNEAGDTYAVPDAYYLLQNCKEQTVQEGSFTMPAAEREVVNLTGIPADTYTAITFSIGVDSEHNDNLTLQAGELSVMENMTNVSWMWHTSYVFSKLGGTYTMDEETYTFMFETGTNDLYQTISQDFDEPLQINGLQAGAINLQVDIATLLDDIAITDATLSGTTYEINPSTPTLMAKLAANYAKAFTLQNVANAH